MRILAKITAGFFLALGLPLALLGLGVIARGLIAPVEQAATPMGFDFRGWMRLANVFVGGAVLFQGMLLAALGEGLWLLADLTSLNADLVRHLRRGSPALRSGRAHSSSLPPRS